METTATRSMHPLAAIAAVSLTLFSLAGIGAITGLIPTSHSQITQAQPAAEAPAKAVAAAQPSETATAPTPVAHAPRPATHKTAVRPVKPVQQAAYPVEQPVAVARADTPAVMAQTPPPPPQYQPAPARPVCYDCGVIESVREVEKPGQATGTGAAVGGIAGGILGHQAGNGRGRDVMTVLGALGGAFAGHQIEKSTKKQKSYAIDIRLDDGSSRVITQDSPPPWRSGDRIRLVDGVITASNSY